MVAPNARRKALDQLSALDIAKQREADGIAPAPLAFDDMSSNWVPPPRSRGVAGDMPANPASEVALLQRATGQSRPMLPDDSFAGGPSPRSAERLEEALGLGEQMALAGRMDGERVVRDLDHQHLERQWANEAAREDGARAVAMLDAGKGRPFKGISPEDAAELDAQQERFQQGLRLRGQAAPQTPRSGTGTGRHPVVDVATVGPSGPVPQARPLSAPRPDGASPATASVGRDTSSKPPGDGEFAAAMAEASDRRRGVAIGKAGARINQALSGVGFDEGSYDKMAEDSDSPVRRLLAQREADKQKALTDPASEQSKRVQAAVAKSMPGVYSPEELSRITAADADMVTKYGAMRQRLEERKADMAREDVLRAAKEGREDAIRADERKFQAQQAGAGRSFQASQADKAFARQKELASLNNAADLAQVQARSRLGPDGQPINKGTTIPGLEVEPGAAPTAEDAKKVKTSRVAAEKMRGYVAELRALHDKYGTEYGGAAGTRMEQLGKAIQLEAKTIAELGALSGPDQELMQSISGADPASLGANLKALVGIDNTATALQGLEKWVGTQEGATQRVYGYRPSGGQQQASAGGAGERKQYSPSRNVTRVVDAQGNVIRTEQGDTRGG